MGFKNVIFSLKPKHFVNYEDHFGMEGVSFVYDQFDVIEVKNYLDIALHTINLWTLL